VVDRDAFLARRLIATLATEEADGSAYLTAVWYLWADGAFWVPTSGASRKARNAAARPRASILIDARTGDLAGFAARGSVELVTGGAALALNAAIHARYLTKTGVAHPELGRPIAGSDDVTLQLTPERWSSWDLGAVFGDLFADAALVHPLDG
jgi:PPOX class probable F420-dependent enzyme